MTVFGKKTLGRQTMCNRLSMEFQNDWVVNLGVGMPTLCAEYEFGDCDIILQSENGLIGYGPAAKEGEEDENLVDAGNAYVTTKPGMAVVQHVDSFAVIRGGYIDVTVLGSYEVAENGDFSNWKTAGRTGGSIGGAMDLAIGAKRVWIVMAHTTKDGKPRLMKRCTLPVTAIGVVSKIVTDLGLFEVTNTGFTLKEIAPGFTPVEVQLVTDAQLTISENCRNFRA